MTLDAHWFIRARLKTRQLLLLQALEDEGNIHRAAQTLNLTQPAASKLLKELDEAEREVASLRAQLKAILAEALLR